MKAPTVSLPPPARFDVGWGTAYERWAVYRLLRRWLPRWEVGTALEGPVDGMAGIPGLHLVPAAEMGAHVTVLVPTAQAAETVRSVYRLLGLEDRLTVRAQSEFPVGESFDLVLSYAAAPCVRSWEAYLGSGAACARRFFVVSVSHRSSYGVFLRKALRLLEAGGERGRELFDHPSTDSRVLEPFLRRLGPIVEDAYVDCPWWPDLFVQTGETLLSGTLGRLPFGRRFLHGARVRPAREGEPFVYGPGRFPFLGGPGWEEEVSPALRRHPVFDEACRPLASVFAHHRVRVVARDRIASDGAAPK